MTDQTRDDQETMAPAPGIMVSGYFHENDQYRVIRKNGTDDWLIIFTESGNGAFMINETQFVTGGGNVTILSPGTMHCYYTLPQSEWRFYWAHFIPDPGWGEQLLQLPQNDSGMIRLDIAGAYPVARLKQAFLRLVEDNIAWHATNKQLALNALEEIILLLVKEVGSERERKLDPRIREVLQILAVEMSRPHRIDELAVRVQLSASRLSHLFKEQVGQSIIDVLHGIRLGQAARLLERTSLGVAAVADEVGFDSPFYFTKLFKLHFGMSPSEYRKQMRVDQEH